MTAGARVAAFAALLTAIFALAAIAGSAAGPIGGDEPGDHAGAGAAAGDAAHHEPAARRATTGLRVAASDTTLTARRAQRLEFEIQDAGGVPLRSFEVEQGRRMHLIVVRRDLRRFQHLHPVQDAATGGWSVRLALPDAGVYHAFADFRTAGRRQVVGVDLFAAGAFAPLPLPPASTTARTDGYDVTLDRNHTGALRFAVSRDGAPVSDLQPYLGSSGHLVILRAGDLAYVHVHPVAGAGALTFDTGAAAPGTYRLFLQFRHDDAVHTAAFTQPVTP